MSNLTDEQCEKISTSFSEELEALCKTYDVEHLQITAKLRGNPCCIQAFIPATPRMWSSMSEKHDEKRDEIQSIIKDKLTTRVIGKIGEMINKDESQATDVDDIKKFLDDLLG